MVYIRQELVDKMRLNMIGYSGSRRALISKEKEVMPMGKKIVRYILCLIILFLLFMVSSIKAN